MQHGGERLDRLGLESRPASSGRNPSIAVDEAPSWSPWPRRRRHRRARRRSAPRRGSPGRSAGRWWKAAATGDARQRRLQGGRERAARQLDRPGCSGPPGRGRDTIETTTLSASEVTERLDRAQRRLPGGAHDDHLGRRRAGVLAPRNREGPVRPRARRSSAATALARACSSREPIVTVIPARRHPATEATAGRTGAPQDSDVHPIPCHRDQPLRRPARAWGVGQGRPE